MWRIVIQDTDGQHHGLSNDTDSQQAAVPFSGKESANHLLAAQMAQGHHVTAGHGGDPPGDRQQPAGTSTPCVCVCVCMCVSVCVAESVWRCVHTAGHHQETSLHRVPIVAMSNLLPLCKHPK